MRVTEREHASFAARAPSDRLFGVDIRVSILPGPNPFLAFALSRLQWTMDSIQRGHFTILKNRLIYPTSFD